MGFQCSCGEGNGTPLQYSCLKNSMGRGAWWAAVRGVAKSQTQLSGFTFTFHFHALEKEMATHSSILAWRISGTGEPGGLPSMRSHRVGHDWSDLAAAAAAAAMFLAFWGSCPSYVRTIKLFCGKTSMERDWGLCFLSPQKWGKVINVSHCFKPPSFGVIRSLQKDFNSGLCHHLLLPTVGEGDSVHTSQPCFSQ